MAENINKTPAKQLFGAKKLPAYTKPKVHGFYSKGCIQGAIAIPTDGPNWQAMRLSRNRRWGHPKLIKLVEELSKKAARDGWPGLLVGDIAQPRGGPMLSGHASHQIGLDADIWLNPMPRHRMSYQERENTSAISMLKKGTLYVDNRKWTKAHEALLRNAAQFPEVERMFVHPGIKKKLCDTVKGDRRWLRKVRPYYGHHYHFHIRMKCPSDSPNCRPQARVARGTGCDKSLAWWFTSEPWGKPKKKKKTKPAKKKKKKKRARRYKTLADLPKACRYVLRAKGPTSIDQVTLQARRVKTPVQSYQKALNARKAKKSGAISDLIEDNFDLSTIKVPTPKDRPYQQ
jgi:penicillin-insensitive murein endopeptidase